jgi:hypothetical protein
VHGAPRSVLLPSLWLARLAKQGIMTDHECMTAKHLPACVPCTSILQYISCLLMPFAPLYPLLTWPAVRGHVKNSFRMTSAYASFFCYLNVNVPVT